MARGSAAGRTGAARAADERRRPTHVRRQRSNDGWAVVGGLSRRGRTTRACSAPSSDSGTVRSPPRLDGPGNPRIGRRVSAAPDTAAARRWATTERPTRPVVPSRTGTRVHGPRTSSAIRSLALFRKGDDVWRTPWVHDHFLSEWKRQTCARRSPKARAPSRVACIRCQLSSAAAQALLGRVLNGILDRSM